MINKKKKKGTIWFLQNEDAKGYKVGDNRILTGNYEAERDRLTRQRRIYNI